MGLLSSSYSSASATVEKPDFVQLLGNLPLDRVAGCRWCKKTIFWNGSFWNHVEKDTHECPGYNGTRHDKEVVGHEEVEVGRTMFRNRPIRRRLPVHRCAACGEKALARADEWGVSDNLGYRCPAKVATPQQPRTTVEES